MSETTIATTHEGNPELLSETAAMVSDPAGYFGRSERAMHSISRDKQDEMLLAGLKLRFGQLRDRVPILKKLADEQGVDAIVELDDVVPLLFSHTVYKSYPISLLEKGRFTQLMRWLQKLTTVDLSAVDVSGCTSIDEWIRTLDEQTPLRIRHSSGTTGHMSFIPRTEAESARHFYSMVIGIFDPNGVRVPSPDAPLSMDIVIPQFRAGNTAILRTNDYFASAIAGGDEANMHFLYPGRQSSDMMFLAGRLRAAQALGDHQQLDLSPALLARKDEFEALARNQAADMEAFFNEVISSLNGRQVYAMGTWNVLYNLAQAGLARGVKGVLAPDSVISAGGGAKGQVVPPDWESKVLEFLGVRKLTHGYGMTEVMGQHKLCSHERFHIEPWTILFVLDPDSGAALPRVGRQTGRAAFFDLLAETYWGGFVTGDEVTVEWSEPCPCGRTTAHIARTIERYSQQRGGDDKISCAAAADAHDAALTYLTDVLQ